MDHEGVMSENEIEQFMSDLQLDGEVLHDENDNLEMTTDNLGFDHENDSTEEYISNQFKSIRVI